MLDTYKYKVDFSEVKHYIEIHEILKRDLDFPDYYGGNLDALWDCLTDQLLSGITYIEIRGTEILDKHFPEDSKEILRIFKEAKHAYGDKYSDKFFVTVIHSDGTIREIQ